MRILGIAALIMTGLSLFFWLLSWVFFTFILPSAGYDSPVRYVAQASGFLSSLTEYVAIGLLSVGLVMISKRVVK